MQTSNQPIDRSSGSPGAAPEATPYNFSPGHFFPGYYNMHGGTGSPFFGGFHPSQLAPGFSVDDPSTRRESFASNFDVSPQYAGQMGKLPSTTPNMGHNNYQPNH